ncbi:MAG: hypothetical protein PHI27_06845 [Eubacteriales bacterium]|nr:hypothetical protein [Eubacteriales bacterium]MDD3881952.1 hypothetical protein [Eubacteriales bacterium]MDD4513147.1 hypothetical protein [Eubacteriales bacterium]
MRRYLRLAGQSGTLGRAELEIGSGGGKIHAELDSPLDARLYVITAEAESQPVGSFSRGKTRLSAEYYIRAAFVALVADSGLLAYSALSESSDTGALERLFAPLEENEAETAEESAEDSSAGLVQDNAEHSVKEAAVAKPETAKSDEAEMPDSAFMLEAIETGDCSEGDEAMADLRKYPFAPAEDARALPVSLLPTLSFPHGWESVGSLLSTEYGIAVDVRDGWRFCKSPENPRLAVGAKISRGKAVAVECAEIEGKRGGTFITSL